MFRTMKKLIFLILTFLITSGVASAHLKCGVDIGFGNRVDLCPHEHKNTMPSPRSLDHYKEREYTVKYYYFCYSEREGEKGKRECSDVDTLSFTSAGKEVINNAKKIIKEKCPESEGWESGAFHTGLTKQTLENPPGVIPDNPSYIDSEIDDLYKKADEEERTAQIDNQTEPTPTIQPTPVVQKDTSSPILPEHLQKKIVDTTPIEEKDTPGFFEDLKNTVYDYFSLDIQGLKDIGHITGGAAQDAVIEGSKLLDDTFNGLDKLLGGSGNMYAAGEGLEKGTKYLGVYIPPETDPVSALVRGTAKVGLEIALISALTGGMGSGEAATALLGEGTFGTIAARLAESAVIGAQVDILQDPEYANLSTMFQNIKDHPEEYPKLLQSFQSQYEKLPDWAHNFFDNFQFEEDDSNLMKRLKSVGEGAVLGFLVDMGIEGIRAFASAVKVLKASKEIGGDMADALSSGMKEGAADVATPTPGKMVDNTVLTADNVVSPEELKQLAKEDVSQTPVQSDKNTVKRQVIRMCKQIPFWYRIFP